MTPADRTKVEALRAIERALRAQVIALRDLGASHATLEAARVAARRVGEELEDVAFAARPPVTSTEKAERQPTLDAKLARSVAILDAAKGAA